MTVLTRMLHGIDGREWPSVRASLADEVRTDYTSLHGGSPQTTRAEELVDRWSQLITGFTATLHVTGPVVATGDRLDSHVVAYHWLDDAPGGEMWSVYGHYIVKVVDGRIAELTLQTFRQTGNRDLITLAMERSASVR